MERDDLLRAVHFLHLTDTPPEAVRDIFEAVKSLTERCERLEGECERLREKARLWDELGQPVREVPDGRQV